MKKRVQYNWKFKENESPEFLEWFENQENISSSLRSVVYHMIELYGTGDFLDPSIQRKMVKDSLKLESLKGENLLNILLGNTNVPTIEKKQNISDEKRKVGNLIKVENEGKEIEKETENVVEEPEEIEVKKSTENTASNDDDGYDEIDPNAL